jgi:hypothetical protein
MAELQRGEEIAAAGNPGLEDGLDRLVRDHLRLTVKNRAADALPRAEGGVKP